MPWRFKVRHAKEFSVDLQNGGEVGVVRDQGSLLNRSKKQIGKVLCKSAATTHPRTLACRRHKSASSCSNAPASRGHQMLTVGSLAPSQGESSVTSMTPPPLASPFTVPTMPAVPSPVLQEIQLHGASIHTSCRCTRKAREGRPIFSPDRKNFMYPMFASLPFTLTLGAVWIWCCKSVHARMLQ